MPAIHTVGVQERSRGGADCVIKKWRNMCIFQIVPFPIRKENTIYHSFNQKAFFPSLFCKRNKTQIIRKEKEGKKPRRTENSHLKELWDDGWSFFLTFHFHHHHICAVMKVESHLLQTVPYWRLCGCVCSMYTWMCVDLCIDCEPVCVRCRGCVETAVCAEGVCVWDRNVNVHGVCAWERGCVCEGCGCVFFSSWTKILNY